MKVAKKKIHSKGGKHAECYFSFMLWKHLCLPGTWGLILTDSSSHFQNSGSQCLLPTLCSAASHSVRSRAELGSTSPGRDWGSPVWSLPVADIIPACRGTGHPSPYPFSQTQRWWWLTPWPAAEPGRHPGADSRMRRGHCLELPPPRPSQVLTSWSHIYPHGPFLTTHAHFRNRQKLSHYCFFYLTPEISWLGHFPLFLSLRASGSPWCLSGRSQQHGPLLSTPPQPSCSALSLHSQRIFIFNLLSSFATSIWHGWECNRDSCLQRDLSTLSSESPIRWVMLIGETTLIFHAGLSDGV